MSFKVGDKVRVHYIVGYSTSAKCDLEGRVYTINRIEPLGEFKYSLSTDNIFYWSEKELELVKPKFDIKDYPGKYAIRCRSQEQANVFDRYMRTISDRDRAHVMNIPFNWRTYSERTCYFFNEEMFGTDMYKTYTYLEFEDFDWSDYMNTKFTKKDLKNGDVVKFACGSAGIVCVEAGAIVTEDGYVHLDSYRDDLTKSASDNFTIVSVQRPNRPSDCQFCAIKYDWGTRVYERKDEPEEMTLAEVCKALGKEIKIVKE